MGKLAAAMSDSPSWTERWQQRLRSELVVLLITLLLGLLVVPLAIFYTGQLTLGTYREGAGLGSFLGDYFARLAGGQPDAWILALGPLSLLLLLRGVAWLWRYHPPEREDGS